MTNGKRLALAGLLAGAMVWAVPMAASASHGSGSSQGGGGITKSGRCSASGTWKLKAKPDNGRIEVEFEVDSNVNGQSWNVVLTDNGQQVFKGTKTTQAPSGSFTVSKRIANQAGTDKIKGNATNPATGENCAGALSL
jgi:hypothetical protein